MTPIDLGCLPHSYRGIQLGVKTKKTKERIRMFIHFLDRFHNRETCAELVRVRARVAQIYHSIFASFDRTH